MSSALVLSIDAMGGDDAPEIVVDGVAHFLKGRKRAVRFLLHGDEAQIKPLLARHEGLAEVCDIRHSDSEVDMSAKPSEAVRRARGSSMWNAVRSVKEGEAQVAVSAGNTGALMAISKVILRMKKGVHRPAIAASWPAPQGFSTVLDVGANVDCSPSQLVEFAVLGEAFHRAVHGEKAPTVGLLNVGQEELKGGQTIRDADSLIRKADLDLDYRGFIEGDDISAGTTNVVVTDGFTGNVALKTAEGTARLVGGWLREALTSSLIAKLASGLLSLGALGQLRAKMDPRNVNGGVFLGLNGVVVKSHGGTDALGFATSLRIALEMADSRFLSEIERNLERLSELQTDNVSEGGNGLTYSRIAGIGSYLPEKVLTNKGMEAIVETSDEWIRERTGINKRHIAGDGERTSDLGVAAARRAVEHAGLALEDVDLIIVATATPDLTFPATATIVQHKLGVKNGFAFDVHAVCSGFLYALATADTFIRTGQAKCALVIGAETFSRILDWTDRTTCVLFGDGAGAMVLTAEDGEPEEYKGVLKTHLRSDGEYCDLLYVDGGPSATKTVGHLRMQGNQVFRHAVTKISDAMTTLCAQTGVDIADIDWVVPHQANQRILLGVAKKLGISVEQVISTVAEHGNTSAASIPLAFDAAVKDGRIKRGDTVLMEALGGGFTWGAALVRY